MDIVLVEEASSSQELPLLHANQNKPQHNGYKEASFSSAVFSLSTGIVGAGIMGLPAAMKTIGLAPGVILLVLVGLLTNASIHFMLKYSNAGKAMSYGALMADSFGRTGGMVTQVCIIINNLGLLVVYLIIIADVLSGSSSSSVRHSGVFEEWAGGQTWWTRRTVVMLLTTVFILAPLVSFRHVDSLMFFNALSVALAMLFVLITVIVAIYKLIDGTIDMPAFFPMLDKGGWSIFSYFSAVPVVVTAFICHQCIHPVLNELKNNAQSMAVVRASLIVSALIYGATGVFGYLLFGNSTLNDVLANFDVDLGIPYSMVFSDIVRMGYAVHVMLVFPLLHFSLRVNLDELIFSEAVPLSKDGKRFFLLTACLMVLSYLGASFIPSIWDAFQITGSTTGVCIGYIFPGMLVLRDAHGIATMGERCTAWIMVMLAIGSSIIALAGDIMDLVF